MKSGVLAAATLLIGVCATAPANAGVYGDDLAKCLVNKASPADQSALVLWIYSAMSAHPDVKAYSSMTEAKRRELAEGAGLLMVRLLAKDCRKETVAALKYEGEATMPQAFGLLGQVAMRNLMSEPTVAAGLGDLDNSIDQKAWEDLAAEAGIPKRN